MLANNRKLKAKVELEEIIFNKIFEIALILKAANEDSEVQQIPMFPDSQIRVTRRHGKHDNILLNPKISTDNANSYSHWLGLEFVYQGKKVDVQKQIGKLLDMLSRRKERDKSAPLLLSNPGQATPLSFSNPAKVFFNLLSNIRRYDILQHELRKEQQISTSKYLGLEGTNMPSVLSLIQKKNPRAWKRILRTLAILNPFVNNARISPLRTGKEFVEFTERKLLQPVESWEASDGTLRGLAILLALETQPKHSTILIEEPEQNLHPWAISCLIQHMRQAIEERNIQVILTTHSQQVLEAMYPEEIRVVTRSDTEGTQISKLKDILPNHNIEIGEVGRLWVKGLLGGVPSVE